MHLHIWQSYKKFGVFQNTYLRDSYKNIGEFRGNMHCIGEYRTNYYRKEDIGNIGRRYAVCTPNIY